MSIDYNQLKALVKEAMFTGGGINEPSAPEDVPYRMPAADTDAPEQEKGDPAANKMYEIALVAREAVEKLVEALDDPTYDAAYEHAFKASACMRRVLNSIEFEGAYPMPWQRVVAAPVAQQKYTGGSNAGDFAGGAAIGMGDMGMQEVTALGSRSVTQSAQAQTMKGDAADIEKGDRLQGVDDRERAILQDVQALLIKIADEGELYSFKSQLQAVLKSMLDKHATSTGDDEGLDLGDGE